MSPSSLTTSTTRRLLTSSSETDPATRCPRTCLTRNSTTRPSAERSHHHCSFRSEKNQRTIDKLITLLKKVCCQVSPFSHTQAHELSSCQKRKSSREMENERIGITQNTRNTHNTHNTNKKTQKTHTNTQTHKHTKSRTKNTQNQIKHIKTHENPKLTYKNTHKNALKHKNSRKHKHTHKHPDPPSPRPRLPDSLSRTLFLRTIQNFALFFSFPEFFPFSFFNFSLFCWWSQPFDFRKPCKTHTLALQICAFSMVFANLKAKTTNRSPRKTWKF